jgi:hypothetical protein
MADDTKKNAEKTIGSPSSQLADRFGFAQLAESTANKIANNTTAFVNEKCNEIKKFVEDQMARNIAQTKEEISKEVALKLLKTTDDVNPLKFGVTFSGQWRIYDGSTWKDVDAVEFAKYTAMNNCYAFVKYTNDHYTLICCSGYVCDVQRAYTGYINDHSQYIDVLLPYCVRKMFEQANVYGLCLSFDDIVKIHQIFKDHPELCNVHSPYLAELTDIANQNAKRQKEEDDKLKARSLELDKFSSQLNEKEQELEKLSAQLKNKEEELKKMNEDITWVERRAQFSKALEEFTKNKKTFMEEQTMADDNNAKFKAKNMQKRQELIQKEKRLTDIEEKLKDRSNDITMEEDKVYMLREKYMILIERAQVKELEEKGLKNVPVNRKKLAKTERMNECWGGVVFDHSGTSIPTNPPGPFDEKNSNTQSTQNNHTTKSTKSGNSDDDSDDDSQEQ